MSQSLTRFIPAQVRRKLGHAVRGLRGPQARRYIPFGTSVTDFFSRLHDAGVACVVLRWFEALPYVRPGEDIDMLVADSDLAALARWLDPIEGETPCDIYSVGGLKGTRYKNLAYFPAALAENTIRRRRIHNQIFQVPCPQDHFMGLAYHAVYQKGPASGLPTAYPDIEVTDTPEHDYAGYLRRLADDINLETDITMEALDIILAEQGYRPEPAMLAALLPVNPWLARHLQGT